MNLDLRDIPAIYINLDSEIEKNENEAIIDSTDKKIETLRLQLNEIQEQSIQIREIHRYNNDIIDNSTFKFIEQLLER